MRQKIFLFTTLTILLVSCGSTTNNNSVPSPIISQVGTDKVDSNIELTQNNREEAFSSQGLLACRGLPNSPMMTSGRIKASGSVQCLEAAENANLDAMLIINKLNPDGSSMRLANKTVNFNIKTIKLISESELKADIACKSGSYNTAIEFYLHNAAKLPGYTGTSKEYDIYCGAGNQFIHPNDEVAARIAVHGLREHPDHFQRIGITTVAQVEAYVLQAIRGRFIDTERYVSRNNLLLGKVMIWDNKTKFIIIYDPTAYDRGTVFKPDDGKAYFDKQR